MGKLFIVEVFDGENFEETDRVKSMGPAIKKVEKAIGKTYGYLLSKTPRRGYFDGVDTHNYTTEKGAR